MKRNILIGLLLSFYSIQLMATDYFVSKTGANTYQSIQEAVDIAQAGDTIYIKSGTYNERVYLENTGTKSNPIKITNFSSDKVILDGSGIVWEGTWGGLFDISNVSYINISGFKIINAHNAAIFLDKSKHINIQNMETHNSYSSGIGVWDSDNIVLKNNEVSLACNDGGEECISIANSHDVNVTDNEVHHNGPGTNGGEGIDIKMGSYKVLVNYNHVHHINKRIGLYADAWNKHTYDIKFDSNIVHDCTDTGMAVATEQGGLIEHVTFVNNIVYNNSDGGMAIGGWSEDYNGTNPVADIKIIHNTFYANSPDGIYIGNNDLKDIKIYNNIIANSNESQIYIENSPLNEIDIQTNIIMGEMYGFDHSNDIIANPNFVNAAGKDFHLKSDSPAINEAIATDITYDFDKNIRPNNLTSDIGAYEFVTATATDTINAITGPATITKGEEITLTIDYVASQDRTIAVYFQSLNPKKMHFYKRITVHAGDAVKEVTFTVPDDIPTNGSFRYKCYIAPKGGKWSSNLGYASKEHVRAISVPMDDSISSITGPATITKGEEITLTVDYVASQDRTIAVYFQSLDPKKMHFYKRVAVNAGDALKEVTFTVPDDIPTNGSFRYKCYIAPKGGKWSSNLGYASQKDVVAN